MSGGVLQALDQRVLVKPVRSAAGSPNGSPVGSPTSGGFKHDWSLRCRGFSMVSGAAVGRAAFDFIPTDGTLPSFEKIVGQRYTTDDLVRVVVPPIDHEVLGSDLPASTEWLTVFEGVFDRIPFEVGMATGMREEERMDFIGVPLPVLDNVAPEHLIRGRWVAADPTAASVTPAVVESMDLPAVFNFRGRPNMSAAEASSSVGGGKTLTAPVFTHDDDAAGKYWTVGQAIASILMMWGFGPTTAASLPRGFSLDAETLSALVSPPGGVRWDGLASVLPEVNVHGLGVLEAVDAVCDAAGFEMQVMPHYGLLAQYDRLYVLSINRSGGGPEAFFRLQPRGTLGQDHAEILRNNSISRIRGVLDASRVRNEVMTVGRSYIEAAVELRPLWLPDDATEDVTEPDYALRHVSGGDNYGDYRQVGRAWGVDCTGEFEPLGYDSGPYQHDDGGFDWVAALDLDGGTLAADRQANGVADPIVWTRRLRHLLPIKRAASQAAGVDYIVEVSEDGGGSWSVVPIAVTTMRQQCGVILHIDDLSKVSVASLRDDSVPTLDESWWGLMFPESDDPQFAVRVTCCVSADHAALAIAPRQASSGSVYPRRAMTRTPAEEVWAAPGSLLNETNDLVQVQGWGSGADAERLPPLDVAERARDARETATLAASAETWNMDFHLWTLGDRVSQLAGRNFNFALGANDPRRPSIVGIHVTLSPEGRQGVRLDLSDRSRIGGQR